MLELTESDYKHQENHQTLFRKPAPITDKFYKIEQASSTICTIYMAFGKEGRYVFMEHKCCQVHDCLISID